MNKSKLNIVFIGHDLKFLFPLIEHLQSKDMFELRIIQHSCHEIIDEAEAQNALTWSNVIFCEWALGNAVWFSQRKREDQVLIVRLHLQEVQARDRMDYIWKIHWDKVDRLILITHHLYDWMRKEFPLLINRSALIYNPIPAIRKLNVTKRQESRFVLGLVGIVPARKRLDLAIEVLKTLRKSDKRYFLKIKGALPKDYDWMTHRSSEIKWYQRVFDEIQELRDLGVIIFDPYSKDMATWYKEIGHILSVSDFEGSHQSIAEGMATGCVPAIRDWIGAERIYPSKYVAGTVEQLAKMILRNSISHIFERESEYCRNFSQLRFDEGNICDKIEAVMCQEVRSRNCPTLQVAISRSFLRKAPTMLLLAYIPIGSRSGYRIRVEQQVQALVKYGCIVHIACLIPENSSMNVNFSGDKRCHLSEFTRLGCCVHLIEVADFFGMHGDLSSFKLPIEQLVYIIRENHIDVLHAEALYCARIAKAVKQLIPHVAFSIDWHGVVPEEARMGGASQQRIAFLEFLEQALLSESDLNIFVSSAMRDHYKRKYRLMNLRLITVPCCVSDDRFTSQKNMELTDNRLIFLYTGSLAHWQCGMEMIKLFSLLHQFDDRCYLMLLIPKPDQGKVIEWAVKFGLTDKAYYVAEVNHQDVPKHLYRGHLGLLLRRNDPVNEVSSPTKFGEYLAAGLPVLMTDCIGDFSRLAIAKNVGFIVPVTCLDNEKILSDPDFLRDIIQYAEQVRADRLIVSTRCQTVAKETLSWESAVNDWIGAYKDVTQIL